jgi:MoaA/NifB/PqqE/SkfB family radical SAM enzyme
MSSIKKYNRFRATKNANFLCHAPYLSMHISQNGIISSCSLTRFTPIGHYPKQSLQEIWWGEKAVELRKRMKSDEFPPGCEVCRADFDTGNFGNIRARHYDQYASTPVDSFFEKLMAFKKQGRFAHFPKVISFELSNTCNLECVSCIGLLSSSIRKNREKMPPIPQLFGADFLQEIAPFLPYLEEAKFYGGEPFLINLYLDIWEAIASVNPKCCVYITTNGTVFNQRIEAILKRLKNVELIVSLDGITKYTLEKIRVNAKYETVFSNLFKFKEILELNGKRLTISPTYMRYNWQEYPALLDFASNEQLLFQTNLLLTPKHLSIAHMRYDEIKLIYQTWKLHEPFTGPNPEINHYNRTFFNDAVSQVQIWMNERESLEQNEVIKKLYKMSVSSISDQYFFDSVLDHLGVIKDPALMLTAGRLMKEADLKAYFSSFRKVINVLHVDDSLLNLGLIDDFESAVITGERLSMTEGDFYRKIFHPQVIFYLVFHFSEFSSVQSVFSRIQEMDVTVFESDAFNSYYGY